MAVNRNSEHGAGMEPLFPGDENKKFSKLPQWVKDKVLELCGDEVVTRDYESVGHDSQKRGMFKAELQSKLRTELKDANIRTIAILVDLVLKNLDGVEVQKKHLTQFVDSEIHSIHSQIARSILPPRLNEGYFHNRERANFENKEVGAGWIKRTLARLNPFSSKIFTKNEVERDEKGVVTGGKQVEKWRNGILKIEYDDPGKKEYLGMVANNQTKIKSLKANIERYERNIVTLEKEIADCEDAVSYESKRLNKKLKYLRSLTATARDILSYRANRCLKLAGKNGVENEQNFVKKLGEKVQSVVEGCNRDFGDYFHLSDDQKGALDDIEEFMDGLSVFLFEDSEKARERVFEGRKEMAGHKDEKKAIGKEIKASRKGLKEAMYAEGFQLERVFWYEFGDEIQAILKEKESVLFVAKRSLSEFNKATCSLSERYIALELRIEKFERENNITGLLNILRRQLGTTAVSDKVEKCKTESLEAKQRKEEENLERQRQVDKKEMNVKIEKLNEFIANMNINESIGFITNENGTEEVTVTLLENIGYKIEDIKSGKKETVGYASSVLIEGKDDGNYLKLLTAGEWHIHGKFYSAFMVGKENDQADNGREEIRKKEAYKKSIDEAIKREQELNRKKIFAESLQAVLVNERAEKMRKWNEVLKNMKAGDKTDFFTDVRKSNGVRVSLGKDQVYQIMDFDSTGKETLRANASAVSISQDTDELCLVLTINGKQALFEKICDIAEKKEEETELDKQLSKLVDSAKEIINKNAHKTKPKKEIKEHREISIREAVQQLLLCAQLDKVELGRLSISGVIFDKNQKLLAISVETERDQKDNYKEYTYQTKDTDVPTDLTSVNVVEYMEGEPSDGETLADYKDKKWQFYNSDKKKMTTTGENSQKGPEVKTQEIKILPLLEAPANPLFPLRMANITEIKDSLQNLPMYHTIVYRTSIEGNWVEITRKSKIMCSIIEVIAGKKREKIINVNSLKLESVDNGYVLRGSNQKDGKLYEYGNIKEIYKDAQVQTGIEELNKILPKIKLSNVTNLGESLKRLSIGETIVYGTDSEGDCVEVTKIEGRMAGTSEGKYAVVRVVNGQKQQTEIVHNLSFVLNESVGSLQVGNYKYENIRKVCTDEKMVKTTRADLMSWLA